MITERRQIQAIADMVSGMSPNGVSADMMSEELQFIYNHLSQIKPDKRYSRLTMLRLENEDLTDLIDDIIRARPGHKPCYQSLAELGPHLPKISWLWPGWIPRGVLTLLAAWPGVGKTYVALDLGHRIANGVSAPDREDFALSSRNVIYVDAEDFLPAIYDRTQTWGTNTEHFFPVQRPPRSLIDMADQFYQDELIDMVYDLSPAVVIVDSLSSVNSRGENNIEDLREVLSFLVELAKNFNTAVLLIHHLRKPRGNLTQPITMHDLRGSGHLIAMARSVLGVDVLQSSDPNGPRSLKMLKTNLSKYPKPLAIEFKGTSNPDVAALFYGDIALYKQPTDIEACAEWLLEALADGPRAYADLKDDVEMEMEFNETTLQRARKHLGNKVSDTTGSRKKGNQWILTKQLEQLSPEIPVGSLNGNG